MRFSSRSIRRARSAKPRPPATKRAVSASGTIVSARSGETEDTSIVHLAIGWGAGQLKVGSFARSERMAKWNEALADRGGARSGGALRRTRRNADAPAGDEAGRAGVWRQRMTAKSLSIEGGALAIPEPDASGVRVYKGIPYAAPPLGPLRWRPPEPVRAVDRRAAHRAPSGRIRCRASSGTTSTPTRAGVSEDCLYLNVWTPAAPGDGAALADDGLDSRRRVCRRLRGRAAL